MAKYIRSYGARLILDCGFLFNRKVRREEWNNKIPVGSIDIFLIGVSILASYLTLKKSLMGTLISRIIARTVPFLIDLPL
ncbi:hypothetical protein MNBD_IGNAVI01-1792 [hydrothermal vent metagenome]|uniref:Uncharacterized protein n=1 Tax=hydrothermal vent metagenome TaxID=652676 RepID=A0A3B1CPR8_9ZZZZ